MGVAEGLPGATAALRLGWQRRARLRRVLPHDGEHEGRRQVGGQGVVGEEPAARRFVLPEREERDRARRRLAPGARALGALCEVGAVETLRVNVRDLLEK